MYEKCKKEDIIEKQTREEKEVYEIDIEGTKLICICDGTIYREMKSGFWKQIENKRNHNKGYNVILIKKRQYMRSKIMLMSQQRINPSQKNINIYHINGNRLDCGVTNLTFDIQHKIQSP